MVDSKKRSVKYRVSNDDRLRLLKKLMRQKIGEIKKARNSLKQTKGKEF